MIKFERFELSNGLKILIHENDTTPMVAVNIVYNVGARDEEESKTGFAHLFEHLMFGGSVNIPDFDKPLQMAGGESNAFTNSDITNYYDVLPASNLETAFWLESDRMMNLDFSPRSLEVQRKVVIEEFKEHYINKPYGDVWHNMLDLSYQVHPYKWPTIGKNLEHIADANLDDVKNFFYKFYRPKNAVMVVAGGIKKEEVLELAEKWFGNIPSGEFMAKALPIEPRQETKRTKTLKADVPANAMYLSYHMCSRNHDDYYPSDLTSDVLSNGQSSRLFQSMVKEQKLFSNIGAYVSGSFDQGLMVVEGKLNPGVDMMEAEKRVQEELLRISQDVSESELQKVKSKVEAQLVFSEMEVLNKAMNLAYFELLSKAEDVNEEKESYSSVSLNDIKRVSTEIFRPENCSALYYQSENNG